jgi:spore maturation protein CgeB
MRILAVLERGTWAETHLVGSLLDMGHDVETFFYGPAVGEFYGRARKEELTSRNAELLSMARRAAKGSGGLQLILCYVYDDFLRPETARALSCLGVPMVNFNVDMVNQWYRQSRTARYFTAVLCAQKQNMLALAAHGARTWYFPMAARSPDSKWTETIGDSFEPAAPVTFVGTPMPFRKRVLRYLSDAGVSIAVYGKFWRESVDAAPDHGLEKTISDFRHYGLTRLRHEGPGALTGALAARFRRSAGHESPALPDSCLHGFLPQARVAPLFARSRINIGFTRMTGEDPWAAGSNQVKLRDFEVPMAGGFYLVERAPDYDELFVPGVEVETWGTPDELKEKIEHYLGRDEERASIAARGLARAQRDHSWRRRFEDLFGRLDIARS